MPGLQDRGPPGSTEGVAPTHVRVCSECARLIDLADGNKPRRIVESDDLVRHEVEDHAHWLEVIGIDEV